MAVTSYIGKGNVWIKRGTDPWRKLGNCSSLKLAVATDKKTLPDFTSAGGGNDSSLERINSVSLEMDLRHVLADNLGLALNGDVTSVASGTVSSGTPESVTVNGLDTLHPLAHAGATSVVVKDVTNATTYVLNEDYEVTGAGIIPLSTGDISDADVLHVSYSYPAQDVIQALTAAGQEYSLMFDGLNESNSGSSVVVEAYRVKPSPTDGIDYIGDDYATLKIKAEVLKDSSKTGTGVSQFFKETQVR